MLDHGLLFESDAQLHPIAKAPNARKVSEYNLLKRNYFHVERN